MGMDQRMHGYMTVSNLLCAWIMHTSVPALGDLHVNLYSKFVQSMPSLQLSKYLFTNM